MSTKIFLTGATGYIGGSVLYALLQRPDAKDFEISVLTRQEEKAKAFEAMGLRAVGGSLDDVDIIREEVSKADIVVSLAHADHAESVRAMLEGMAEYKKRTRQPSIFIHTSGTGVLTVDARGRAPKPEDPVYDDSDADQIETIPDSALHRDVDLMILAADKRGDCLSYIVLPSTIYGVATGDLGTGSMKGKIINRHSQQMPDAIKTAIARGQPGMVGEGKNVWPHVHIDDLMQLYMTVFDLAKDRKGDHGREGFYFGANGHYEYRKAMQIIGENMQKRGVGKSAEPSAFTDDELKKNDSYLYRGTIGQCKAERAKKYGWKPRHTTDDFYASLEEEVEYAVQKMKEEGRK